MKINRRFTQEGQNPHDTIEWVKRSSKIANPDGSIVFEMNDVEVPASWSQLATDIMVSKYFRKAGVPSHTLPVREDNFGIPSWLMPRVPEEGATFGPETSAKQVIHRLVGTWTYWGCRHGYFDSHKDAIAFYDELFHMMANQMVAPNSPQWFNTGLHWAYGINGPAQGHWYTDPTTGETKLAEDAYTHPQPHACQPYDALVATPRGLVKIGDLVTRHAVGEEVLDDTGCTRIVAVASNGQKMVHRINLSNGSCVEATSDHVVWVSNNHKLTRGEWLRVDQVAPGVYMKLCKGASVRSRRMAVAGGHGESRDDAVSTVSISESAVAGWLLTDGHARLNEHPRGPSLMVEAVTINDDERAWILPHLSAVIGDVTTRSEDTVDPKVDFMRHRAHGERLRPLVEGFDLLHRKDSKRVPQSIMDAPEEVVVAFLRSVFQADAHVNLNDGIVLASVSPEFLRGVQHLLQMLGIYSVVRNGHDNRDGRLDPNWLVIGYHSERKAFADTVGFVGTDKAIMLEETLTHPGKSVPDTKGLRVVSVEAVGVQDVYDIQTESGKYLSGHVLVHNCFLQSIEDDLVNEGGIMDLWVREARLFKYGSGTGTNFSNIRGKDESLSGGGRSSGLMSFLKIGDAAAGSIKSGGTTRRAAKLACLDIDHPDIEGFINWKVREEIKVAAMVEGLKHITDQKTNPNDTETVGQTAARLGLKLDYDFNGESYQTVSGQNSNNSVRIPHEFFRRVDAGEDWELKGRVSGKVTKTLKSRDLWDQIAYAAWRCADPGVQFDDTINEWHTCPASGRINTSNPCGEYNFLDNTACNLASLNLLKFYDAKDRSFDITGFEHGIDLWTMVLEISVLMAAFPSKEIAKLSYEYRTLGLGYANIGAMLMQAGIPYDSDQARAICGAITSLLTGRSYAMSANMAAEHGPFPGYDKNGEHMLRVIRNHRRAAYGVSRTSKYAQHEPMGDYEGLVVKPVPLDGTSLQAKSTGTYGQLSNAADLLHHARHAWSEALRKGEEYGYRNAQTTCIAPTGTIGLLMDCDTTGVEPDFALVKFKKLAGGGYFAIVNQSVEPALRSLGYSDPAVKSILKYVDDTHTIEGAPHLQEDHYAIFDCANRCGTTGRRSIHAEGHIRMMAAAQPFISGAISKTINLPNEATLEDIKAAYHLSWELGLKSNALYRDGCKLSQPLNTSMDDEDDDTDNVEAGRDEVAGQVAVAAAAADPKIVERVVEKIVERPMRRRLPDTRNSKTHKFSVANHEGYITVGMYDDGTPGEVFITMSKEGSTVGGLMDSLATAISIALQYGVPIGGLIDKFTHQRFEPAGMTLNRDIPFAKSLVDYVFRWIGMEFVPGYREVNAPKRAQPDTPVRQDTSHMGEDARVVRVGTLRPAGVAIDPPDSESATLARSMRSMQADAPACDVCGTITVRSGTCYKCLNCGNSMGCS